MTTYTAGWNMPGYLPETDPETFETLSDAAAYLRDTLERWMDEDADMARAESGRMPVDVDDIFTVGPDYADGWYRDIHLWAEETQA